ncbi:hypothetical protein LXL04_033490 [Taraxacum kok-saghyz]
MPRTPPTNQNIESVDAKNPTNVVMSEIINLEENEPIDLESNKNGPGKYKERAWEYKRMAVEDRIRNLPGHLTDSILERLPIKEAVRTSILSRKWRYRWTTMRELVFDEQFSKKFAKTGAFGHNGFIRIINQAMFLHEGPLLKFHLHIPHISLDSFQEVDQWMLFLSRNGVTELILTNSIHRYQFPFHVFSCLELRKLELTNCLFKPPLEFKGFPNLEDLELTNINFGDNLCGCQISLPQLKTLSLYMCINVCKFSIKATNLWSLVVLTGSAARSSVRVLVGPYITMFGIQDFVAGERKNLSTGLSHLPGIKDVHIDSIFLKCLFAENIPKWLPHTVNSLKRLRLQFFQVGDLNQLHGALCLLRNSPNLEQLYLKLEPRVDEGPALNHLESSNCLDCTLNQLELVEITDLHGSRPEMLFIELLLAHSPSLHKFIITPSRVSMVKKRLAITIDVMQFSRASPKAKLFFINS